jgi:hypothetical protein
MLININNIPLNNVTKKEYIFNTTLMENIDITALKMKEISEPTKNATNLANNDVVSSIPC